MYSLKRGAISCYIDGYRKDLGIVTRFFDPRVKYFKLMERLEGCSQRRSMPMNGEAQFNFGRRYKTQDIAILFDSQFTIQALDSHEIKFKIVIGYLDKIRFHM